MLSYSKLNTKLDTKKIEEMKELSNALISSINDGRSFFEFIPKEIGQITFCSTTVNKEKPSSIMDKLRNMIPYTIFPIILLTTLYHYCNELFPFILFFTVGGFCYYIYKEIIKFENLDFFVGTKGFCYVKFKKRRNNIVYNKTILFDNVTDFFTQEIDVIRNIVYDETQYFLQFISVSKDTYSVEFYERHRYKKGEIDIIRIFYNEVIKSWNAYKMKDFGKIPMYFHAFIIEKGVVEETYKNYIEVECDRIKIGGKDYFYNELRKIELNGTELMIESKNHQIIKKSFWRKEELGDIEHIGLNHVSNFSFFVSYFLWLKKEKKL